MAKNRSHTRRPAPPVDDDTPADVRPPQAKVFDTAATRRAAATAPVTPQLNVRATADGYYGDKLRRIGDVFFIDATPLREKLLESPAAPGDLTTETLRRAAQGLPPVSLGALAGGPGTIPKAITERLDQPAAFSPKWMEEVDDDEPESITSHNEVIRREHDATLAQRLGGAATGDHSVLGD
jgi:hypothetical protein